MTAIDRLHLGDAHHLDASLAVVTFGLGVLGIALVALGAPLAGGWCGVLGVASGLWGQLVSRTRPERFLDVVGVVAAAVAVMVGFARAGLTFTP